MQLNIAILDMGLVWRAGVPRLVTDTNLDACSDSRGLTNKMFFVLILKLKKKKKKHIMFVHCDQFEIEFLNLPSYIPDFVCHDLSKYVKNHCRDQLSMKHY